MVGTGSAEACLDVVHAGTGRKFVSIASTSVSFDALARGTGGGVQLPRLLLRLVASNVALQVKRRARGVGPKFIFGSSLIGNEVSRVIYEDFLPQALADGRYVAAPEPEVVGQGVGRIQAGLDAQLQGVSAQKLVVTLWARAAPARHRAARVSRRVFAARLPIGRSRCRPG